MKLREFNFNQLKGKYIGLTIFVDDKEVTTGFIGEVLKKVTHLADKEIKATNGFFNEFVIRL